jgi:hypothetical protein
VKTATSRRVDKRSLDRRATTEWLQTGNIPGYVHGLPVGQLEELIDAVEERYPDFGKALRELKFSQM